MIPRFHRAVSDPIGHGSSERRHRNLARRLEPWCAAAPERQYLALLRNLNLLANDYADVDASPVIHIRPWDHGGL